MADGVFGRFGRRLAARKKQRMQREADKKKAELRKRGAKNRSEMMAMLEKKGADAAKPKAKAKPASTGVRGNLASAGAASAGRAARADKAKKATKRFEQDTKDLGAANMRMNAAQKKAANKRVKSTDGKSDKPSAASMRDSAAQRAALAKSEPKKESKPAEKKERFGVGDKYVIRGNKANVRKDQLEKTGLTQAQYMKQWRASGKRPTAATAKKAAPKKAEPKKDKPFNPVRPNQGGPGMLSIKPPKGPASPMAAAAKLGAKGEDEMPIKRRGGGMMKSKMKAKGMKAGGKMKTKGYMAGGLKDAPEGNKGLKKLPKQVRNKMGFKAKGGMMKTKGYAKGGMKTKGYMAGGKMKAKGMAKGGKVRGAGIARKGVRPAKMR